MCMSVHRKFVSIDMHMCEHVCPCTDKFPEDRLQAEKLIFGLVTC